MPTYRVPVRVEVRGFIYVEADDPHLAAGLADDIGSYEGFDVSQGEWINWDDDGEPVEVEP